MTSGWYLLKYAMMPCHPGMESGWLLTAKRKHSMAFSGLSSSIAVLPIMTRAMVLPESSPRMRSTMSYARCHSCESINSFTRFSRTLISPMASTVEKGPAPVLPTLCR
ncbi:hypothetical protein RvY_17387 [Ramazzottius varieornatus]|uniref:Uncharacterized protein n=1 Tax=Ramazzottius varieornatus TaxID=947166 RepID=A0A1D1W1Y1_RAMVA|nr:hypothetical protein RvY_17387 [Ramazzottius varieornatus]